MAGSGEPGREKVVSGDRGSRADGRRGRRRGSRGCRVFRGVEGRLSRGPGGGRDSCGWLGGGGEYASVCGGGPGSPGRGLRRGRGCPPGPCRARAPACECARGRALEPRRRLRASRCRRRSPLPAPLCEGSGRPAARRGGRGMCTGRGVLRPPEEEEDGGGEEESGGLAAAGPGRGDAADCVCLAVADARRRGAPETRPGAERAAAAARSSSGTGGGDGSLAMHFPLQRPC